MLNEIKKIGVKEIITYKRLTDTVVEKKQYNISTKSSKIKNIDVTQICRYNKKFKGVQDFLECCILYAGYIEVI